MPDATTHFITCPVCEAECGLEITIRGKEILSIRGDQRNAYSRGFICPKAVALKDLYNDPDRLKYPLKRTGNDWRQISWKQAFDEIEQRVTAIRNEYGNNALAFFMGNPNVHYHGNALYLGFLLKALKTRNRYSSSSLDQLPLMMCCYLMFGHQLLFPVPDIDRTDFLLIIGANPVVSGGSIMTASGVARRLKGIQKRHGRVVVIDPVFTKTAALADCHLFISPGTDVFFLAALVNTVFEEGLAAPGRLEAFTDGIDTVKRSVKNFTAEKAAGITGIKAADIRRMARDFCRAEKAVCYGRMGTSVQEHGSLSTWLILVFNIITGKMDNPGGFMFPTPALDLVNVTARANEKGYIGRHHTRVSGLPDFAGEFPASVLAEEILTEGDGRIRALITIAGNPVLSAPNGRMVDKALQNLDFMAAIDWYVTESSRHAHIILPPTCILEHHNFMTMINLAGTRNFAAYTKPVFQPQPDTRHSWEILSELSARFIANPFLRFALRIARPELLLDLLLRFGPHGSGLNIFGSGLNLSKVKRAEHGLDLGPLVPRLPDRLFTKNKKIYLAPEMLITALKQIEGQPTQFSSESSENEFDLLLISRRSLMSSNSWFHNYPSMQNRTNRCTLMVNTVDAENRSIRTGDPVLVKSRVGSIRVTAEVTDKVKAGVVSMPHGWGHGLPGVGLRVAAENPGVSINDITDDKRRDLSGNAAFSALPVRVEK
jgi:anaerobic selenocysteine-containing dehydrogenase